MSPEQISSKENNAESLLQQSVLMTEVGIDLKNRYISGEKYISYLKTILIGAEKTVGALQYISKSSLHQAKKIILLSMGDSQLPDNVKIEFERLLSVVEKELSDLDLKNLEQNLENITLAQLSEKIKCLDAKQKSSDNNLVPTTASSNKCFKADIDEKYPENFSRDSLIDLSNVVNLPPVPEDIFTSFSNKPARSSSLSSLKSMRKIKLFLQKAETSDDEDSSDNEEHDYTRLVFGDSTDDGKLPGSSLHSPVAKKLLLGNIKEESQD